VAGRPLVNLSLAVNYAIGGLTPRGYRIGNLLIHLAAGLVLFGLVRRTLLLPKLAPRLGAHAIDIAFAVALLWTLHPLQTEVVNYIVERTESMMALCYLLTLYFSVRRWSVAAVIACAAGMLCKESMVTAPVMVLLVDRVLVFDSWRAAWESRRRLYVGLAASWLVLAGVLLSSPRSSAGFGSGVSPWTYLLNQAQMVAQYLKLSVWPRALVLDYGLPQPLTLADVWLPSLLVVALLVATVAALVYRPMLGLLGAWFFITLSPTSSFVPIATEVGAERRMYLPLVAIAIGVVLLLEKVPPRRVVVGALAILMMVGVYVRGQEYSSTLAMSQTIVDRWPNGRGHFQYGTALIEAGREQEGMAQLRESARDFPGAFFAIATERLAAGQAAEAIGLLQKFLEAMPMHVNAVPARDMLGRAHAMQGDMAAAEREAREVVRQAPGYASGHDLLGRLLAAKGDFTGASAAFEQLLTLDPGNTEAMQRLAAGNR
jgi:Flp pilus assembly protein TadD